jgi:iron complex outermembrane receptor protein
MTNRTGRIRHNHKRGLLLGAAALALPATMTPAFAQASAPAEVANSNEILVTAQRRNERLEDVPMSVAVVSPETLRNLNINSVRDLANVTSGFQVNNSGSFPQPAIRGVTTTNAGSYENNVALFLDGLYQTTPQVLNMDLPNVQNIQVLKGPQGTLYGRNATGGAILIDTIDPGQSMQGNVEATYGRFNDKRLRGFIAGPLSDSVGISIAGTLRHTDGYYKLASRTTPGAFDGNFLGLKQEAVRAKLTVALSDTLRATLGYNYLHAGDPRGVLFTGIENVATPYTTPGRTTRPSGLGEVAGDIFALDLKQHEGLFKLEWDTGIGKLRSITGYTDARNETDFDSGGTFVPDNYSTSRTRDRTLQENLDFNITAIEHVDLVVGGNYYNIKSDYVPGHPNALFLGPTSYTPFTFPDPAVTPTPTSAYRRASDTYFFRTKEAWAAFANATFHATDRLTVTIGGRYSHETQDVSGIKYNYCSDPLNPTTLGCTIGAVISTPYNQDGSPGIPPIPASRKKSTYSKFTPSASIRYEIAPRTNVYASYTQGFRGGEWNSVIPLDNPANWTDAKQESITAYEVGLKSGGRKLNFSIAGFLYNYKNLQVSSTTFVNGVALVVLQNAPSAKIYGVDADLTYNVTDNFQVRAGGTWLHARYGPRFVFVGTGVNPNGTGYNTNSDKLKVFPNVSGLNQDLSGLQMARAPDFTGYIGFEYNIPNQDGGLRFNANLKYTTSYVVTNPSVFGGETTASYLANIALNPNYLPDNTKQLAGTPYVGRASEERLRQPGYALLSASVTWTDPTDHYYVRAWGNNLTNVKYRVHYNAAGGATGSTYSPIGEPLTFGGTIGAKF